METIEPLLTISVSLLGIGLTAKSAIVQYFKQREYELVLERYLSGSIDLLAASLELQMQNYRYNWGRALTVVKQFRNQKNTFDFSKIDTSLKPISVSDFNYIAQYRLGEITGSHTIWNVYQIALANLKSTNDFITDDLFMMLKSSSGKSISDKERTEKVDKAIEVLSKHSHENDSYLILIEKLHAISKMLETQKLTFKQISKMKNKDEIKSINNSLEESFKEEFESLK